uniref:cDNA FLJ43747 fis, clone TESTI2023599 n=1 Tax=Homo sapiens TaxID=9606 RepID=Q6ZUG0_HUMAN|nr:unnamed protein product [Homo sapiens]
MFLSLKMFCWGRHAMVLRIAPFSDDLLLTSDTYRDSAGACQSSNTSRNVRIWDRRSQDIHLALFWEEEIHFLACAGWLTPVIPGRWDYGCEPPHPACFTSFNSVTVDDVPHRPASHATCES